MARDLDAAVRASLEASAGEDLPLFFLTLGAGQLATPLRLVNDTGTVGGAPAQWLFGGETFLAFPFAIQILTDTDQAPRAEIEIANVDRRIGAALLALDTPLSVTLVATHPDDFDVTVHPREPIGTPRESYRATGLWLREVDVDAMTVRGTLGSIDDTQEPYPGVRATASLLPGLWR